MTVDEAIAAAEAILPGQAAAEDDTDPRWQAVIAVAAFIETEPEAVWSFVLRWGDSPDDDLRAAIATCVLEHLLQHDFDGFFDRVAHAARANQLFANTVSMCWVFGQSEEPERSARFERLRDSLRGRLD